VDKVKLTRSSGNVFRDLGFSGDEAEHLKVRAELMVHVQHVITARRLKQAEAAALLIEMLARLGIRAKLVFQPRRRRAGAA
jgi:predicted XRE-type DNA-binding protein